MSARIPAGSSFTICGMTGRGWGDRTREDEHNVAVDAVEFVVRAERHPPVGEWRLLDIRVNGARLQELVDRALRGRRPPEVAEADVGPYMGLDPADAGTGHFIGQPVVTSVRGQRKL